MKSIIDFFKKSSRMKTLTLGATLVLTFAVLPACGGSGSNTCTRSDPSIIDDGICSLFLSGCEEQNFPSNATDPECHGEMCPCAETHTD